MQANDPKSNDKPNVLLTNEEFTSFFAQAEARGRAYADDRIKLLEERLAQFMAPKDQQMKEFTNDVGELKTSLSSLDSKVKSLDTALRDVLSRTESIVAAIHKNSTLLTVMQDSAKLGVESLDNLEETERRNIHISMARQYLSKALLAYDKMRN